VFADALGGPLHPDSSSKAFAAAARLAGLKGATLHSLRHSAATWALGDGNDVRTVATLLGHSALSTTLNVYSHVIAGRSARVSDGLGETLRLAQARRAAGEKRGSRRARVTVGSPPRKSRIKAMRQKPVK
jgi:integrase